MSAVQNDTQEPSISSTQLSTTTMTPTSNHDTAPDSPNQPSTNTDTTPSSVLFAASLQGPLTLLDTKIRAQLARYAEEVLTLNLSGQGDRIEPPRTVLAALELPEETKSRV